MLTYTIFTDRTVEETRYTTSGEGAGREKWGVDECHQYVEAGTAGYTRYVTVQTDNVTIWHETATGTGSTFYMEVCPLTEAGLGYQGTTSYNGTWYPDGLRVGEGTASANGTHTYVGASSSLGTCGGGAQGGTYECEIVDYFNTYEPFTEGGPNMDDMTGWPVTTPVVTHTDTTVAIAGQTTETGTFATTIGAYQNGYIYLGPATTTGTRIVNTTYSVSTVVTTSSAFTLSVYDQKSNSVNPGFGPPDSSITSWNVYWKDVATVVVLNASEELYEVTEHLTTTATFGDPSYFLKHVGPTTVTIINRYTPPAAGPVYDDSEFATSSEDTSSSSYTLRTTASSQTTVSYAGVSPFFGGPLPMEASDRTYYSTTLTTSARTFDADVSVSYSAPNTVDTWTVGTTTYSVQWMNTPVEYVGTTTVSTNITVRALNSGTSSQSNDPVDDGYYAGSGTNSGGFNHEWSSHNVIGAISAKSVIPRIYAAENAFVFGYGLANGDSFQMGTRIEVDTPFTFNPGWMTCSLNYILVPHPATSFLIRTSPGAQLDTLFCRATEVVWQSSTTSSTAITVGNTSTSSSYTTSTTTTERETFPYNLAGSPSTFVDLEGAGQVNYKNRRGRMKRGNITELIEAGPYRLTAATPTPNTASVSTTLESSYRTQTLASSASRAAKRGLPVVVPPAYTWQGKYYTFTRAIRPIMSDDNLDDFWR